MRRTKIQAGRGKERKRKGMQKVGGRTMFRGFRVRGGNNPGGEEARRGGGEEGRKRRRKRWESGVKIGPSSRGEEKDMLGLAVYDFEMFD